MFLFHECEMKRLRERAKRQPYIFKILQQPGSYPVETDCIIPEISRGNWGMYYYCPKDSHRLKFDWEKPSEHVCPICGAVYSGEPYDGAWETLVHNENADTALRRAYLYVLTQKPEDAAAVAQILTGYAEKYPNYREHGDILYNGPGMAFAQTLDEAVFLRKLGYAYDMVSEVFSKKEQEFICKRLFRVGAEFLIQHREKQVHNHEVLIHSSIGILGLLLQEEEIIKQGLYVPFALLDQRKQGVLSDDFWFEGSFSYHQYALTAFYAYEIFARHTQYSPLQDLQYLRMAKKAKALLLEDNTMPALNDSRCLGQKFAADLTLEFSYYYYRDETLLQLLHIAYQATPRESMESFFFGVETLPPCHRNEYDNYHDEKGSGITVLRGREGRYLLVKHSPFGGEHDHYDRLGISFAAFGDQLCSDLGTVPYGVPWHYDYYKNTGSHNTVMVNEENQPPQKCSVLAYECNQDAVFLDCLVQWNSSYIMPPSFVIKQWDEKAYAGTRYRRRILWKENYFIDVVTVQHPEVRCTDWVLHIDGEQTMATEGEAVEKLSEKKPFCYLSEVSRLQKKAMHTQEWKTPHGYLRLFSLGTGMEIYTAKGPNCPPDRTLQYVVQRRRAKECVFVNVFEAYQKEPAIKTVQMYQIEDGVCIEVNHEKNSFLYG